MRPLLLPLAAIVLGGAALPAIAGPYDGPGDHHYVDREELRRDRADAVQQRRELEDARRHGSRADIQRERQDFRDANRETREDARDWQRGRRYSYAHPDPRYGGYYADNYYRGGGNYRAYPMGANDRIYRGRDNRYYCRRSDGTTGLIIGAVGGGVLGDAIAPGGSKTVGALFGGGLGALLGRSIDRGNLSCR